MAKKKPASKTTASQRKKTISVKKIVAEINRTLAKLEPAKASAQAKRTAGGRRRSAVLRARSRDPVAARRARRDRRHLRAGVRHPVSSGWRSSPAVFPGRTRASLGSIRSAAPARRAALSPIAARRRVLAARRPRPAPVRAGHADGGGAGRRRRPRRRRVLAFRRRAERRAAGRVSRHASTPAARPRPPRPARGVTRPAAGFARCGGRAVGRLESGGRLLPRRDARRALQSAPHGQRRAAEARARGAAADRRLESRRRAARGRLRAAAAVDRLGAGDHTARASIVAPPRTRRAAARDAVHAARPDVGRAGLGRRRRLRLDAVEDLAVRRRPARGRGLRRGPARHRPCAGRLSLRSRVASPGPCPARAAGARAGRLRAAPGVDGRGAGDGLHDRGVRPGAMALPDAAGVSHRAGRGRASRADVLPAGDPAGAGALLHDGPRRHRHRAAPRRRRPARSGALRGRRGAAAGGRRLGAVAAHADGCRDGWIAFPAWAPAGPRSD